MPENQKHIYNDINIVQPHLHYINYEVKMLQLFSWKLEPAKSIKLVITCRNQGHFGTAAGYKMRKCMYGCSPCMLFPSPNSTLSKNLCSRSLSKKSQKLNFARKWCLKGKKQWRESSNRSSSTTSSSCRNKCIVTKQSLSSSREAPPTLKKMVFPLQFSCLLALPALPQVHRTINI